MSEALDANGEFFTTDRLLAELTKTPPGSAADIARAVYQAVKGFAGKAPQSDDITVLAVRYTPKPR